MHFPSNNQIQRKRLQFRKAWMPYLLHILRVQNREIPEPVMLRCHKALGLEMPSVQSLRFWIQQAHNPELANEEVQKLMEKTVPIDPDKIWIEWEKQNQGTELEQKIQEAVAKNDKAWEKFWKSAAKKIEEEALQKGIQRERASNEFLRGIEELFPGVENPQPPEPQSQPEIRAIQSLQITQAVTTARTLHQTETHIWKQSEPQPRGLLQKIRELVFPLRGNRPAMGKIDSI